MCISAINLSERLAMTDAGEICPIKTLLDEDGDETGDIETAVFAIGPLPDGMWFRCDVRYYDTAAIQ